MRSRLDVVGKNAAWYLIRKQLCIDRLVNDISFNFVDIGAFAPAEDLQALPCEGIVKACKCKTWPIEVRYGDLAGQASPSRDTTQRKVVLLFEFQAEQVQNGKIDRFLFFHNNILHHLHIAVNHTINAAVLCWLLWQSRKASCHAQACFGLMVQKKPPLIVYFFS